MTRHPPDDNLDKHRFIRIIDALSEASRRDIVADIVAHPKQLPCMAELTFTTGLHRTTIHQHLSELIAADIVEPVEIPVGERTQGKPSKFYGLTDDARDFFDHNNVYQTEHWQDLYAHVDKPAHIETKETAPRPAH